MVQKDQVYGVAVMKCREVVEMEKRGIVHEKVMMYTRRKYPDPAEGRTAIMRLSTKHTDPELMEGVIYHVREVFTERIALSNDIYTFTDESY